MSNDAFSSKEYFPEVGRVRYEGKDSNNSLAYRWYDESQLVAGKTMKECFHFAVAYWHSFCATGKDPFASATRELPWDNGHDALSRGKEKMDAAFEFISKLGLPYYCFHDFDLIEEDTTIGESDRRLEAMVKHARQSRKSSGIRLLWGTANLFSHKRYMNGDATNPDFGVLSRAATHVKRALDVTIELGGEGYVF